MAAIHDQLQAHLNQALAAVDPDAAVEHLEDAVELIDAAVGFTAGDVPELDEGATAEALIADARTHIRNDDLVGCRIRVLQVIEAGGPDVSANVPTDKPLEDMKKAELVAFAAAQDPPIPISASSSKAGLLETIQDELAARETAGGEA